VRERLFISPTPNRPYLQACVRRRAVLSVAANPACPDTETAEKAVNEVWDSCFPDTRPFDEVSWPRPVVVHVDANRPPPPS
jgi:hypothetical protein